MFWLELFVVLAAIFVGSRLGGIGLGVTGFPAFPGSRAAARRPAPGSRIPG